MSFLPTVPLAGPAGLAFLDRTMPRQVEAFERGPEITRDVAHFRANAAAATTAGDLVSDRRLLRVALGAFGLDADLDKPAFIRKVLEDGVTDPQAFANRLADPAYRALSEALGYGDVGGLLGFEATREDLIARYKARAFEAAVGESDVSLRLALTFRRAMPEIAAESTADTAGWFRILGSRPLRTVIEGAFGLPEQFASLELDRQRETLEDRMRARYGSESPAAFTDPAILEDTVRLFLVRAQAEAGPSPTTRGATAVTLLQGAAGPIAATNLFRSRL